MSEQFEFINENEISHLFHSYLQEMNVGDAFDQILDDVLDEEFSEAETLYVVQEILMPEVICLFAEKYTALDETYGYESSEDNLNPIFETYRAVERLSGIGFVSAAMRPDYRIARRTAYGRPFCAAWPRLDAAKTSLPVSAATAIIARSGPICRPPIRHVWHRKA
jgi:hypothetical protein